MFLLNIEKPLEDVLETQGLEILPDHMEQEYVVLPPFKFLCALESLFQSGLACSIFNI